MDGEIKAVDFSFARIPAALLAAAGVHHVFRYLADPPNDKIITPVEYADDVAHGITVHFNWETSATRPLDGTGAGLQDGAVAKVELAALGATDATVICSLDTDPSGLTAVQYAAVHGYLQAFATASGHPVGIYGGAKIIDASAAWPEVVERWQTAAWSGQYLSPHADYYQRIGHSWSLPGVADNAFDEDVVIHPGLVLPPEKPMLAPHYNIQLASPIVDVLACPAGGFWQLCADGSIMAWLGAPYKGGANAKPYFVGRSASQLAPDGQGYTIVANTGERYDYP